MTMHVSEINIYPIKSLKGMSLDSAHVEKLGIALDRRWMLTDPEGMFFTQREVPKMAAIVAEPGNGSISVRSEGYGGIEIPFEPETGDERDVVVWQSVVRAAVYGADVNEWFSEVLGRRCQLTRMGDGALRHVNQRFDTGDDIVSFADGFPVLLIGAGSLEELNLRIAAATADRPQQISNPSDQRGEFFEPLPMNRFRPNIVVSGSVPFAEDQWSKIRIGEAEFRVVKPCARCVTTTVDQERGEFDGNEPLRTLASFRRAKEVFPDRFADFGHGPNEVLFGENLIPLNPGARINLGDEVEVMEIRA